MARIKEFDEEKVLDLATQCFWMQGYEGTSLRDLIKTTGLAGASIYNAFGDKRALYEKSLDRYVARHVVDRMRRCQKLPPREAIDAFFAEIVSRSLNDPQHKGCMLINAALDDAPHDRNFRKVVSNALLGIEQFFYGCVVSGQADGTISRLEPAEDLARNLLGVLISVRVLARVRPEKTLMEGIVALSLALLDEPKGRASRVRNGRKTLK
jgi:TetR/AcrR family transcriptional repressor of nem operon